MRMWINEKDHLFDVWIQQGVNQPDLSIYLPIKQPPSDLRNHPHVPNNPQQSGRSGILNAALDENCPLKFTLPVIICVSLFTLNLIKHNETMTLL